NGGASGSRPRRLDDSDELPRARGTDPALWRPAKRLPESTKGHSGAVLRRRIAALPRQHNEALDQRSHFRKRYPCAFTLRGASKRTDLSPADEGRPLNSTSTVVPSRLQARMKSCTRKMSLGSIPRLTPRPEKIRRVKDP